MASVWNECIVIQICQSLPLIRGCEALASSCDSASGHCSFWVRSGTLQAC